MGNTFGLKLKILSLMVFCLSAGMSASYLIGRQAEFRPWSSAAFSVLLLVLLLWLLYRVINRFAQRYCSVRDSLV